MTERVLYERCVSSKGKVTYRPVGVDSCGTMKPGVWLVYDHRHGHRESWIANLGDLPKPMDAAALLLHRDAICKFCLDNRCVNMSMYDYVTDMLNYAARQTEVK